jgi:hypothetical protein
MTATLSHNDSAVLSALFSGGEPSAPPVSQSITNTQPDTLPNFTADELMRLQALETTAIRPLATSQSPSKSDIQKAIEELSRIIGENEGYPSAYNNRAQALRLRYPGDLTVSPVANAGVLEDLDTAVRLCLGDLPENEQPSQLAQRIAAKALTQRGFLLLSTSESLTHAQDPLLLSDKLPARIRGLSPNQLEDLARHDFDVAASFGDELARKMSVKMNPVAKLCGQMVKEALMRDVAEGLAEVNGGTIDLDIGGMGQGMRDLEERRDRAKREMFEEARRLQGEEGF